MAGVCLDALNNPPSKLKLNNLDVDALRLEIRDGTQYMNYVESLNNELTHYALIGPSTNWVFPVIANIIRPQVIIIGNEPDGTGPSSWSMTLDEYIALWNRYAPDLTMYFPTTKLCAAGMVGTTDYLQYCWPYLNPKPQLVNKHYPNNKEEVQQFNVFGVPVIVGEWCWKTASQQEMQDWVHMLNSTTYEHFWFCWSDGMVPGMGLVTPQGRITNTYRRYKNAIHTAKPGI